MSTPTNPDQRPLPEVFPIDWQLGQTYEEPSPSGHLNRRELPMNRHLAPDAPWCLPPCNTRMTIVLQDGHAFKCPKCGKETK